MRIFKITELKKIKISDHRILSSINDRKVSKKMINLNTNNNLINKVVGKKFNKKFLGVSINSKTIKKKFVYCH